ncbi:methyl-accepting chemotaxis protein [Sporomusa sp. KB1]|jgi:methyl-accepting chemotaxis protein|uniref:methyl-accepting chemotaxis protein n=1 Tax=Sporomusa sp. KB1 TaxID=943346 RepID=UPI0011AC669B|nr:methyl-accepting chemotaxis protein [Sporomusa sp. KB1]TWH46082.1 methyl-accepting chemotaxis protein [Sporomusa sp. KB1]
MKSIQTKLTVSILIIFFVALSVLGGLNYWKAKEIIIENLRHDMAVQAKTGAGDVADWLEARKAEMAIMSVSAVVQSGDREKIIPFMVNVAKANQQYDTIGYVDPSGAYVTSLGTANNAADREYFQRAVKGEVFISDPLMSKDTGHLVTVVAVPVKVNDKVTGVLFGAINMEALSQKVMSVKMGQTGYGYVVQGDGLTIIHPNKDNVMKVNSLQDSTSSPALKEAYGHMVKGDTGLVSYEWNGVDKMLSFAPVSGVRWSLAVAAPVAEITDVLSALTMISLVTIVVVLIITALVVVWFARRIAKPLKELEVAANRIADGDVSLTELKITSNDEIGRLGQSFEQMTRNLRNLIQQILGATEQVAASAEELTASSEQSAQAANQIATAITTVAAGADEQLAVANETSAVVEQMSASIQHVAANTNQVADQSAQAAAKAKDGGQAVENAIVQMNQISYTVHTLATLVTKLGERSKEIGQIVATISGIAGQTNLLALNAAIEAARAGEQGRGFAVVAEEVRKLAEQSQEAAKKIAGLIGEIQGDTDRAVVAMNDGTREVETGAEVVNAAGAAFREIVGLVTEVSGRVKEASAAMQQMAASSQLIVGSVEKIDKLGKKSTGEAQGVSAAAEEQLASMEEIASSSQSLAKLAQDLQTAVGYFRV